MKLNLLSISILSSACLVLLSACSDNDKTAAGDSYVAPPIEELPAAAFPSQEALPNTTIVNDNGSLILAESGLSLYTL